MKDSKPTIYDPNFLPTNIYSGVPTFLNLPVLENKEDLKKVDVAVMGVPWEGGCTIGGYSSCTDGPKSIRTASIRYTGYLPDFDIDLLKENLIQAIHKIDVKYPLNQNKRIGLIMHISHLIYQLVHQQNIKQIRDYNKIIMANKKIYNYLCDVFSDIEKVFEIKFSDSDIAMIIKMIKEI